MKRPLFLLGIAIGAGAMYALDPQLGRRRRTLARNKMAKAVHKAGRAMGATSRDVAHRATGLAASLHSRFFDRDAPDEVIEARVRARLGRVSSHPGAIEVLVRNGAVALHGTVPKGEVDEVVRGVSAVRGVARVDNRLEPHGAGERVPGLQGGVSREPRRMRVRRAPSTRMLVAVAGAILGVFGLARQDKAGLLVAGIGIGLVARAAGDAGMERAAGTMTSLEDRTRGIPIPVKIGPAPRAPAPDR